MSAEPVEFVDPPWELEGYDVAAEAALVEAFIPDDPGPLPWTDVA